MLDMLKNFTDVNQVNLNREERIVSLVGGVGLLLYAVIRIPLTAVIAVVGASYLFFRGMRGFCYINDRIGLNKAVQQPVFPGPQVNQTQKTTVPVK